MDFQHISLDPYASAQAQPQTHPLSAIDGVDPVAVFDTTLPPTPPRSPLNRAQTAKPYVTRGSYSDYGPPTRNSISTSDYYHQLSNYGVTVSPEHISSPLPVVPSIPLIPSEEEYKGDPRKKYKCNMCPRGTFFFLRPQYFF